MTIALDHLDKITGSGAFAARKRGLIARLETYAPEVMAPPVLAQCLAQILHESGAFRHVREIWGPTKAQAGYDGRLDLGNIMRGDGKRYLGRDLIQVTGRANYRALTLWARETVHGAPDFEATPELLETDEWVGIGAAWYLSTRTGLLDYARAGNIEMVTRRVNGGLNGYTDRLRWYDRAALVMLGYARDDVLGFQRTTNLKQDGISGPATRGALHAALGRL